MDDSELIILDELYNLVIDTARQVFSIWTAADFSLTVGANTYDFTLFDIILVFLVIDVVVIHTILDSDD